MYLNDLQIRKECSNNNLISPFKDYSEEPPKKPSTGLSCCGYDLTLGSKFKAFKPGSIVIDPTNPPDDRCYDLFEINEPYPIMLPPQMFILAHTVEKITMPDNLVGFVMDKSSLARIGLSVFNTVFEPGWVGVPVLEIVNNNRHTIVLYPGMGICQIMFARIDKPLKNYPDKSGKYQNQTGVTIAR